MTFPSGNHPSSKRRKCQSQLYVRNSLYNGRGPIHLSTLWNPHQALMELDTVRFRSGNRNNSHIRTYVLLRTSISSQILVNYFS